MNWQSNLAALAEYAGQAAYAQDPDFLTQLPVWIDSATLRIIRDLDLISTRVEDGSGFVSANRRIFPLPTSVGIFVVVESVRLVVGNVTQPALVWVSRDAMDWIYPDDHAQGSPSVPRFVCPVDGANVLVGPPPDRGYAAKCFGTQRPLPLYTGATVAPGASPPAITIAPGSIAANGTFISNNFPDLFLAAEMIDVSGWQRHFGGMGESDQPVSWGSEYDKLKTPALIEEARKKLQATGWGNRAPNPVAMPAAPR